MSQCVHRIASLFRIALLASGLTGAGVLMARAAEPATSPLDAPIEAAQKAFAAETNLFQPWGTLKSSLPAGTASADDAAVARFNDGAQSLKDTDVPALRKGLQDSLAEGSTFRKAIDDLQKQITASSAMSMGTATTTPAAPAGTGVNQSMSTAPVAPAAGATATAPVTAADAERVAKDAEKELKKALEGLKTSGSKQRTLDAVRNVVNTLTGGAGDQVEQTVNDVWKQLKSLAEAGSSQVDTELQSIIKQLRGLAAPSMSPDGTNEGASSCAVPNVAAEGDGGTQSDNGSTGNGTSGTGNGTTTTPAPDPKLDAAKKLLKHLTDLRDEVAGEINTPEGKNTSPMQDKVLGFLDYGLDLTKKLNDELKVPSEKVDPANGEAQVSLYVSNLATLGSLYQRISILKGADAKLPLYADAAGQAFLTADGTTKRIKLRADVTQCFTKATGCVNTVPSAFDAISKHTEAQVPLLSELVKKIRAIQRKQAERNSDQDENGDRRADPGNDTDDDLVLVQTPATRLKAQALIGHLSQINDGWQATAAALATYGEVKAGVQQGNNGIVVLLAAREILAGAINLVDETVGGDRQQWVSEQVRLFYFTDVLRLMQSLNPNISPVNQNDAQYLRNAEELRRKLREAEADLFAKRGALSDAKTRLVNLQTELLAANAAAAAASRQATASAEALAALQAKQSAADLKLTEAKNDPNTPANLLKKLETAKVNLDRAVAVQEKNKEASEAAQTAATELQSQLQDEATGLPAKTAAARSEVQELQKLSRELEARSAILALDESDALANARDHGVFYLARATAASTDPARRVEMYAYDDSKTLFLRGVPSDVERVKDIIAGFDRPAPQARVTLWTLQLNTQATPSGSKRMNESFADIDDSLRHMRGEITHVQDLLRNSVNKEVNRIAQQNREILARKGYRLSERASRYFYYPEEVRRRLGFNPPLPCRFTLMEALENLRYELIGTTAAVEQWEQVKYDKQELEITLKNNRKNEIVRKNLREILSKEKVAEARLQSLGRILDEVDELLDEPLVNDQEKWSCLARDQGQCNHAIQCKDPLAFPGMPDAARLYRYACGLLRSGPTGRLTLEQASIQTLRGVSDKTERLLNGILLSKCGMPSCAERAISDMEYLTRWTLADPSHCTTLGETIFVGSLARRSCRLHVLSDFLDALDGYYKELSQKNVTKRTSDDTDLKVKIRKDAQEAATRFVGSLVESVTELLPGRKYSTPATSDDLDPEGWPLRVDFPAALFGAANDGNTRLSDGELTANQLEIILAMETKARDAISTEVKDLVRKIGYLLTGERFATGGIANQLRFQYLPMIGWLRSGYAENLGQSQVWVRKPWSDRGFDAALPLTDASKLDGKDIRFDQAFGKSSNRETLQRMDRAAWEIASLEGSRNSLARATPRVAAADEMIKRLIVVAENDLDEAIVGPHLRSIRQLVQANGVHYGTVQRESVLATNRLIARVDPRATAGLEVSTSSTMLDAAMQLGQIVRSAEENKALQASNQNKRAGSSGLVAGGLAKLFGGSTGAALGAGAFLGLLGGMQPDKAEPRGEIYTLGTGSTFKVTPIFDPSGQALRFKFDYVALTNIREPDGTTDPMIPRVDRHTVNTEVQLSNLELREISRFEATSQLGVPSRKYGGVPFLKDLPVVKEIPILGYFSKQSGRAAVQQESIILGQTTIFPSVSEIVDLLIDVPPSRSLQNRMPGYLGENTGEARTTGSLKSAEEAFKAAETAHIQAAQVVAQIDQTIKDADAQVMEARSQAADTRRRATAAPDNVKRAEEEIRTKTAKLTAAQSKATTAVERLKKNVAYERITADEYERAGVEFRAVRGPRRRDLALVLAEADIRHRRAVEAVTAASLAVQEADNAVETAKKDLELAKQGSLNGASLKALWTAAAAAAQDFQDKAERKTELAKQWKSAAAVQLQACSLQKDAAQAWVASREAQTKSAQQLAESAKRSAATATSAASGVQQRFEAAHQEAEKAHTTFQTALDTARKAQEEADKKPGDKGK